MSMIKCFAPATLANFSVGFDSLGLCLETIDGSFFGDFVSVEASSEYQLKSIGPYAHKLSTHLNDNLVHQCVKVFHKKLSAKHISIQKIFISVY